MAEFKGIGHRNARPGAQVGDTVVIHGVSCEVVDEAHAEQCDCVVCIPAAPWLKFPDNLTGPCADCGLQLQWRPHAPKRPPKLCLKCALARANR